jgi:hypothetical protein
MYTYEQLTGRMLSPDGSLLATGYSGADEGKNAPTEENVRDVGPIPEGMYDILAPVNSAIHGPYALPLQPDDGNEMYGRSGFLIHGDSFTHPGRASEGCIIISRAAREQIWMSGDHRLRVVRELSTTT